MRPLARLGANMQIIRPLGLPRGETSSIEALHPAIAGFSANMQIKDLHIRFLFGIL